VSLAAADRKSALENHRAVAPVAEEPRSQRLRRRPPESAGKLPLGESAQHAGSQRLRTLGSVGDGPGSSLPMIEGDQLAHAEQLGIGEERIGPEPLRKPLAPRRRRPAEIADVSAAEGRQVGRALDARLLQRGADRQERILGQMRQRALHSLPHHQARRRESRCAPSVARRSAHAHVAVAAERSLEEEGVAAGFLLLVEETKDAERRQQITGQLDGCRSKADSGSSSSCAAQ
jgi:hypothetical protein